MGSVCHGGAAGAHPSAATPAMLPSTPPPAGMLALGRSSRVLMAWMCSICTQTHTQTRIATPTTRLAAQSINNAVQPALCDPKEPPPPACNVCHLRCHVPCAQLV